LSEGVFGGGGGVRGRRRDEETSRCLELERWGGWLRLNGARDEKRKKKRRWTGRE